MKKSRLVRRTPLTRSQVPLRHSELKKGSKGPKQGGVSLKRSKLSQVSEKRAGENKTYSALRKQFLKDHPYCKVCLDLGMDSGRFNMDFHGIYISTPIPTKATEVHHRGRRVGKWLNKVEFFLPVCREHHDLIEREGQWARSKGYLLTQEEIRLMEEGL